MLALCFDIVEQLRQIDPSTKHPIKWDGRRFTKCHDQEIFSIRDQEIPNEHVQALKML